MSENQFSTANLASKNVDRRESFRKKLMIRKYKFPLCAICIQVFLVILFGIFVDYPDEANATLLAKLDEKKLQLKQEHVNSSGNNNESVNATLRDSNNDESETIKYPDQNFVHIYGSAYQDSQLFLVTGLTLLFVGLRNNSLSTMTTALFIYTFCLEWAFLCYGFFRRIDFIKPNVKIFVLSVYFAEASMIAWGFILGRCNNLQLMAMSIMLMAACTTNDYICADLFKVNDPGGVLTFNVFGTYYGVCVSWWLYRKGHETKDDRKTSSISSETFAFLGSSILWVLWPTAMGSIFTGGRRHRTVINTYFALLGSAFAAVVCTPLFDPEGKFTAAIIQNAALAGGVTISGSCDTMMGVYAAIIVGSIAGLISVLCCFYVQPFLANKCLVLDTCNSHSLHGVPGLFGAIVAIIASAVAKKEIYGSSLYEVFPARAPLNDTIEFQEWLTLYPEAVPGDNRSASVEALYHLAAMGVTIGFALLSGFISGFILQLPIFDPMEEEDFYSDSDNWHMPTTESNAISLSTTEMNSINNRVDTTPKGLVHRSKFDGSDNMGFSYHVNAATTHF